MGNLIITKLKCDISNYDNKGDVDFYNWKDFDFDIKNFLFQPKNDTEFLEEKLGTFPHFRKRLLVLLIKFFQYEDGDLTIIMKMINVIKGFILDFISYYNSNKERFIIKNEIYSNCDILRIDLMTNVSYERLVKELVKCYSLVGKLVVNTEMVRDFVFFLYPFIESRSVERYFIKLLYFTDNMAKFKILKNIYKQIDSDVSINFIETHFDDWSKLHHNKILLNLRNYKSIYTLSKKSINNFGIFRNKNLTLFQIEHYGFIKSLLGSLKEKLSRKNEKNKVEIEESNDDCEDSDSDIKEIKLNKKDRSNKSYFEKLFTKGIRFKRSRTLFEFNSKYYTRFDFSKIGDKKEPNVFIRLNKLLLSKLPYQHSENGLTFYLDEILVISQIIIENLILFINYWENIPYIGSYTKNFGLPLLKFITGMIIEFMGPALLILLIGLMIALSKFSNLYDKIYFIICLNVQIIFLPFVLMYYSYIHIWPKIKPFGEGVNATNFLERLAIFVGWAVEKSSKVDLTSLFRGS